MHPRHLSDLELPTFIMKMHLERQPIRICIALMLYTGTRLAETIATNWADLTHQGNVKTALVIDKDMSKSGRLRTIPISGALYDEIRTAFHGFATLKKIPICHSIASRSAGGGPMSGRQIERRVAFIGEKYLGRRLTPHMLRHTFATRLLAVTNIRAVQDMLGHRRLTTTQIYTHPNQDQLRDAIAKLDPAPKSIKLKDGDAQRLEHG